ncbi:MAG: hypothetical protein IT378_07365 [Sandaracinaceae bacterium]|nr:hypothetical protein [Sandaracinaceae bacterium]
MMSRNALAAVLVLAVLPPNAGAQSFARELARARMSLGAYDTRSDATTGSIAELGELAMRARGRDATEARFLRAVASADMLLIAERRSDARLQERVARAFGCEPAQLRSTLQAELQALQVGPFRDTAHDALTALDPERSTTAPTSGAVRTRQQAVYFTRVFERLLRADDPAAVLADLEFDPCRDGGECAEPYRHFGPRGRRAVAAMGALNRLLRELEQTAQLGDPFSAALAREVLVDALLLRELRLSPRDWAVGVVPIVSGGIAPAVDADAAIVLAADHLRIGWVPRVGFDGAAPRIEAGGEPLLADAMQSRFPIRVEVEPFLRPLEGLPAHLASRLAGAERIAIVLEPGVSAHVLSRVIASLEAAQLTPAVLAGAGADGGVSGVRFTTLHGEAETPVGVFVRLGGFSTWQPEGRESLPRLRAGEAWQFDMAGLDRATAQRAAHPVSIRYMGTAPADLVLRVALVVASSERAVQLVLP